MNYVLAAMAGVFVFAGLVHAAWARNLAQRLFSLLCCTAACFAISNLAANLAAGPEALVAAVRWRIASVILFHVVLILFVRAQTGAIPRATIIAFLLTYTTPFIANALLPAGISFARIPAIAAVAGGIRESAPRWLEFIWLLHLCTYLTALNACRVEYRRGRRRAAIELAAALGILLVTIVLVILEGEILIPVTFVSGVNLADSAFLALVMLTSFSLRRQSETVNTQLRAIVDRVPAHVYMKDAAGRYVFVNRYWQDHFQRGPQSSLGKTDLEIFEPEVAKAYRSNDRRVFATGKLLEFEEFSSPVTNMARTYTSLKFPISSLDSKRRLLGGISTDVTDVVRLRRAFRASESRLRRAMAAARIASFELDRATGAIAWSDNAHLTHDRRPEGLPANLDAALENIVPEDRALVAERIAQASTNPGSDYQAEYRVVRADGGIRWIEGRGRCERGPDGKVRHLLGTIIDISERKQAEEALLTAQGTALRLREEFAQHLLTAQELERKRLANELHDGLGQGLSLIKNRAAMALEIEQSAAAAVHLRAIVEVVATSIGELRGLVQSLRPVHIEQLGLTQSLRGLLEQTAQSTPIRIDFEIEDVDDLFPGDASTHIYRIVQEALSNLLKHSNATSGRICVERDIRCVRLRMSDDGQGFDAREGVSRGLGLTTMTERVHMLGGAFSIESEPGKGTRIIIEFPLKELPADAAAAPSDLEQS